MGNLKPELTVQLGKETTWGTRVDPTVRLAGVEDANIQPEHEFEAVAELRGDLQPPRRSILRRKGGSAKLDGLVSYEEAPYFGEMLFHVDTDNPDTDTWSWEAPFESSDIPDPRISTFLLEDGTRIYSLGGATLSQLTVTFAEGDAIRQSVEFIGKDVAADAVATATDFGDVTFVMGDHITLYIDPGSDAVGTTAVSDIAFSGELVVNTNRSGKRHLGDLSPADYRESVWEGTLSMVLELSTTSLAYLTAILAATADAPKYNVRIKAASGTYYYQWDFGGALMEQPQLWSDEDGVLTMEIKLQGMYTSGLANWLKHEIKNAGTALA